MHGHVFEDGTYGFPNLYLEHPKLQEQMQIEWNSTYTWLLLQVIWKCNWMREWVMCRIIWLQLVWSHKKCEKLLSILKHDYYVRRLFT